MRKYLLGGLLAAMLIPAVPFAALADHDDHDEHHDHGHHYGWHEREWHHHHHVYRDNYYMEYPATPVYVQPAPVYVQPRPVYVAPPPSSLNIVIPIH
ncbi:MAG TPA: hypothetical protein VFT64_05255 [Rickettsiales bacterium]|nr:hypothetical protein [Rickettsiales bacterium]